MLPSNFHKSLHKPSQVALYPPKGRSTSSYTCVCKLANGLHAICLRNVFLDWTVCMVSQGLALFCNSRVFWPFPIIVFEGKWTKHDWIKSMRYQIKLVIYIISFDKQIPSWLQLAWTQAGSVYYYVLMSTLSRDANPPCPSLRIPCPVWACVVDFTASTCTQMWQNAEYLAPEFTKKRLDNLNYCQCHCLNSICIYRDNWSRYWKNMRMNSTESIANRHGGSIPLWMDISTNGPAIPPGDKGC